MVIETPKVRVSLRRVGLCDGTAARVSALAQCCAEYEGGYDNWVIEREQDRRVSSRAPEALQEGGVELWSSDERLIMRRRDQSGIFVVGVWVCQLLVSTAAWGAPSYTVQEISVADAVKATGPNLSGTVAVRTGFVIGRSFRATPDVAAGTVVEDVGVLPGGDHMTTHAINDAGAMVGSANARNSVRAVLGTRNRALTDLGTLAGDTASEAFGINNSGSIVGYSSGPTGSRAFLLTKQEGIQNLGTLPGGNSSKALGISDKGVVAGSSGSPAGTRAVIWDIRGIHELGTLPGDSASEAFAVNNRSAVVGYSRSAYGVRAFVWTSQTGMQDLGVLPGDNFSRALGINDAGEIVGSSGHAHDTRAVLWNAKGEAQDLNTLAGLPAGIKLMEAIGINAKGQIVALGKDTQDGDDHEGHEGYSRVFLLTPSAS